MRVNAYDMIDMRGNVLHIAVRSPLSTDKIIIKTQEKSTYEQVVWGREQEREKEQGGAVLSL